MLGLRWWISFGLLCSVLFFGSKSSGQNFDEEQFEEELNSAMNVYPGVTIALPDRGASVVAAYTWSEYWLSGVLEDVPEYGFVVHDKDGQAVDIFGGAVPYTLKEDQIAIVGYDLQPGYSVSTVGSAGYIGAINEIAQVQPVTSGSQDTAQAPSWSIRRAIEVIDAASEYIVQELCHVRARPTELVLNLTAGFELVFDVETGSQVTWDLEVVCNR